MFEIPELDILICSRLTQDTLAKCSRVCKKWNRVAVIYIWKDILVSNRHQAYLLFNLILEDFCQEKDHGHKQQQHHKPTTPEGTEQQATPPTQNNQWQDSGKEMMPMMPLSQYGHLVQRIHQFKQFWNNLDQVHKSHLQKQDSSQGCTRHRHHPSTLELFRHLLKQCPNAEIDFHFTGQFLPLLQDGEQQNPLYDIAFDILPRAKILDFSVAFNTHPQETLRPVLAATNIHRLENLIVSVVHYELNPSQSAITSLSPPWTEPIITARPKRLQLDVTEEYPEIEDWSWLWMACGQLKELELGRMQGHVFDSVVTGIQESMPYLDSITLGMDTTCAEYRSSNTLAKIRDGPVTRILSAGTRGWVSVVLKDSIVAGPMTVAALLEHSSTLEKVVFNDCEEGSDVTGLMRMCPKLRTLQVFNIDDSLAEGFTVDAENLIDADPESGVLRSWACEQSLESLQIRISGLPSFLSGHVQENQWWPASQVMKRIGRFTGLKSLKVQSLRSGYGGEESVCMPFILEAGLEELRGLGQLRELYFDTAILVDVQDVEWMVKAWPMIESIEGLIRYTAPRLWLQTHYPHVKVEEPTIVAFRTGV
ncbi:hypothetical protein BG004_003564 [Podila humilis]|nr:hypothetical protein BG004_003564 [Podila humilis]